MNKINLTALLVSSLVLAACTPQAGPITGTEQQKAQKLAQIIESGGKADCKVTNLSDKSSTQIVISGKKMKIVGSDFGQGKKGTMINDGVFNYIWTEGEKTGFKTKLETETPTPGKEAKQSQQPQEQVDTTKTAESFDDTTKYKMDCATRSINDSEFVPPTSVKFSDFADMLKGLPTAPAQ